MSEELKACPFCKCTEIVAGKDYTRGNYRVDCLGCSAFITAPSLELAIQYWNSRPIEDELRAELARRDLELSVEQAQVKHLDGIIARLKEDAERLAERPHPFTDVAHIERGTYCHYCHKSYKFEHDDNCPITLHRALMAELNQTGELK